MHVIEKSQSGWSSGLSGDDRVLLYRIAMDTLWGCVQDPHKSLVWEQYAIPSALRVEAASFVTLHLRDGRLRGCIGTLEPVSVLYQSVHDNTVAAALQDPRFMPVASAELPQIDLTVSILSPAEAIASAAVFVPGQHGIILERQGRRAVFLPEVAAEQGWTREETLSALCVKAGLAAQAWRSDTHFAIFHTAILSGMADGL
ncbi:MAG: AmmeMemoRadiSam system protein A [Kiritimatiellia bacterium]